jgi:hypothetical protein
MDTMTAGALGLLTMNPLLSNTVAGDLATTWRRFAAVNSVAAMNIVQSVEVAAHLRQLTDLHLLPARCRLFRRNRVLVAHDHVEVRPDKERISTRTSHLWRKTDSVRYRKDLCPWRTELPSLALLIFSILLLCLSPHVLKICLRNHAFTPI